MKKGMRSLVLTSVLLAVSLAFFISTTSYSKVQPGAEPEPLFKTDKYSLLIHYMHEIYEHYTVAGKMVKKGDIPTAIIHLKALNYYIDLVPGVIPDKDKEGKPVNKQLYTQNFQDLKKFGTQVLSALESGDYARGKPLPPPDVVTKTCDDCHKNQKIPPPW